MNHDDIHANDTTEEIDLNGEAAFDQERGAIGYILLWLMGVPVSLLFLVFLLRGCT